jgi:hypothetical protein
MSEELKDMVFNTLVSKPDIKDYSAGAILPLDTKTYPKNFRKKSWKQEIFHQGKSQKCVSYAIVQACNDMNTKEFNKDIKLSTEFLFSNRTPDMDSYNLFEFEGTYPKDLIESARKFGICEENLLPNKANPDIIHDWRAVKITDIMRENAKKYKLGSYAKVENVNINIIKDALMAENSVIASIPVTPKLIGGFNEPITKEYADKNKYGNHMCYIIGFITHTDGKEYWECTNTAGKEWGNYGGLFYLPINYPFIEMWVLFDEKYINPSPDKPKYFRTQCGAFKSKDNCQALQLKLKNAGFATYIVQVNGLYKVQCGCFSIRTNAENLSKQLKAKGFDNFITYY